MIMMVYVNVNDWSDFVNGRIVEAYDVNSYKGDVTGLKGILVMFQEIENKLDGNKFEIRKKC